MGMASSSSVIVDQVDIERMTGLEAEDDPPVARYGDCPKAFHVSPEGVKLEAREIHLLRFVGFVEASEDTPDLVHPVGGKTSSVVLFIEPLEPPMPEAPDHA
jgi:hypothetical protein